MKCLEAIKNIFNIIGKHLDKIAVSFVDMFAYTGFLLAIMGGITNIINIYHFNLSSLPEIFLSLGVGVTVVIAKKLNLK